MCRTPVVVGMTLTNAYTNVYFSRRWVAMEFDGFDWDRGNREKCQQHAVPIATIENLFTRPVIILPDRENPSGERRYRAVGTTEEGRKVFVVFTLRDRGGVMRLRPISARERSGDL